SQCYARLDNVAEVRSLTQPLGAPLPEPPAKPSTNAEKQPKKSWLDVIAKTPIKADDLIASRANEMARKYFVVDVTPDEPAQRKHYVTRLDVVMRSDPFGTQSMETLGVLQAWLREELPRFAHEGQEVQ